MQKRAYGRKKQGAKFGHTKLQGKSLLVRGLNALASVVSTPLSAPVIAATRLRGGNAASARGSGARFSVTVPMNASIRAAIAAIGEDAWTPIRYPWAIWDDQLDCWISEPRSPRLSARRSRRRKARRSPPGWSSAGSAEQASGRKPAPGSTSETPRAGIEAENDLP